MKSRWRPRILVPGLVLLLVGLSLFLHSKGDWLGNQFGHMTRQVSTCLNIILPSGNESHPGIQRFADVRPPEGDLNFRWNLTAVTAFFKLNKFQKGLKLKRTPDDYMKWAQVFRRMRSPLIIYCDDLDVCRHLLRMRRNLSDLTRVIHVSRQDLWPFRLEPAVAFLYRMPGYPKHPPNTLVAEYACTTHSKIALLAHAARMQLLPSRFLSWIDLGCFREQANDKWHFRLQLPFPLPEDKVTLLQIGTKRNIAPEQIINMNLNWVAGGAILGRPEVLQKFDSQYQRAVEHLLKQGIMGAEQQMLHAMYQAEVRQELNITVELNPVPPIPSKHDPWFSLCVACQLRLPDTPEDDTKG